MPPDHNDELQHLLAREANHRIKNTLQVTASLLSVQMARMTDMTARAALQVAAQRLLIAASLHDLLCRVPGPMVALDQYLRRVTDLFDFAQRGIAVELNSDCVEAGSSQALLLALFVAEAVVNAAKHGFGDRRTGHIMIELHDRGGPLELRISDDGDGCEEKVSDGSGSRIIQAIAFQLGATVQKITKPGAGYAIELRVPENSAMADCSPGEIRQQVDDLLKQVSLTSDSKEKAQLASRAFALTQKAAAIENAIGTRPASLPESNSKA